MKPTKAPKAIRTVRDAAQETTNKIIAALEAGTVPWQKTWKGVNAGLPRSLATGKPYRGVNTFVLWFEGAAKGYKSDYWATYKQISERGGQVRKGERSTDIVFWKIIEKAEKTDGETRIKKIPLLRLFHVFNLDQADWAPGARLPKVEPVIEGEEFDPIAAAEALVAEYLGHGPSLAHGGNSAFYRPSADHVQMPEFADFTSAEAYYSTLYHELTHSTGHESRLAREGVSKGTFGAFGDKVYSQEELVAEMGAAMLCAVAGIEQAATLDNSAAYLAHWIQALKGDSSLVIKAASAAQKAVDKILGTTFDNNNQEGDES